MPKKIIEKYKTNKRDACNELLEMIKEGIKNVTTIAPDYASLRIDWTLRQIASDELKGTLNTVDKLKITRRFARVTEILKDKEEILQLKRITQEYIDDLSDLNMLDEQVKKATFGCGSVLLLFFIRLPLLLVFSVFLAPVSKCIYTIYIYIYKCYIYIYMYKYIYIYI